jgi:hypothetical protein
MGRTFSLVRFFARDYKPKHFKHVFYMVLLKTYRIPGQRLCLLKIRHKVECLQNQPHGLFQVERVKVEAEDAMRLELATHVCGQPHAVVLDCLVVVLYSFKKCIYEDDDD